MHRSAFLGSPPLIGYVSDERYVALSEVGLVFEGPFGEVATRSLANGAVRAFVPEGACRVTMARPGYGSKREEIRVRHGRPHQFRLLTDGLLGYAWPKWVPTGGRSEFRVHSVEPYHLDLYRQGLDPLLINALGWYDEHGPRATMQITPDGDYSQTGARWNTQGYTSPHHQQFVTAPGRSGLYYFQARTGSGARFGFPWIVSPASPSEPIAVLASNLTWNAYNSFGGRSNYIHPDGLPPSPTVNSRQELKRYTDPEHLNYDTDDYPPLSFDRPEPINHIDPTEQPTDPIEGRAACHLAPAEWRLLAWLEREGFGYDYYGETQLHEGSLDLSAYRVLILSTHPEYWSITMYERVKSWVRDEGGRLMYLGGNGLNCAVEFVDANRVIYRNGNARALRSRGLESRLHLTHESEANLLGVVFDERGIMTSAPYQVIDGSSWVFSGTGLRTGDHFGHHSLHRRCPGGASGHETDKLSPSSPPGTHLLARGLNSGDGGAEMVLAPSPSGGSVFSVGSITYPSSLLVDDGVSRVTANVLARFLEA